MDYFTSDTHFSHGNILKYCKRLKYLNDEEIELLELEEKSKERRAGSFKVSYGSVHAMNEEFIDNINDLVKEDDVLWHLGDFCFSRPGEALNTAFSFRKRIRCKTVNLIWGNHDRYEIAPAFNKTFDKVKITVNNQVIVLDHYAHAVWEKSHRGAWHLYGHSHSNAEEWLNRVMPERRSVDVGVDNAFKILGDYRPFSFIELQKLFANKKGSFIDHHKEED